MDFTTEEIKILKQFGYDPETATEETLELAKFKHEKARIKEQKEIEEKAEALLQEKLEKMEKEAEKKEIEKMQKELLELGVEETEFAEFSKSRLERLLTAEKARANKEAEKAETKKAVVTIMDTEDTSNKTEKFIVTDDMLVNSTSDAKIIDKGLKTGVYDISKVNKSSKSIFKGTEINKLNMLKCKAFATELLKQIQDTNVLKIGHVPFSSIKAKFINKSTLADTTASTGIYLTEATFQDFIVDQALKPLSLLEMIDMDNMQQDDSFKINRRTARGKAIPAGENTAFSAVKSTLAQETVNLKILRYDGGVSDFLISTARIDAVAEELYAAAEDMKELLEIETFWGVKALTDGTSGGSTSTSALTFKGIHEYANAAGENMIVDEQGTAIVSSDIDVKVSAQYKANSKLHYPKVYLVDPGLEGKINNLMRSQLALPTTNIDGGIKVGTINQTPLVCSFCLSSDADAPTAAASAVGAIGGTVNDQVFVQVAAVTRDGLTVKGTQVDATPGAAEALKIAITNRTDDIMYYIYIGSATGTTYFYDAIEKGAAATTDFYILAPPTYPTYNQGRVDSGDGVLVAFSDNPLKGIKLKTNELGKIKFLGYDGDGNQKFQIITYAALEVKYDQALMVGFLAKS